MKFQRRSSLLTLAVACVAVTQIKPSNALAQSAVSGVVSDTAGVPISGAVVSVTDTRISSTTDDRGEFRLIGVAPGRVEIRTRRLGYAPAVFEHQVTGSDQDKIRIQLSLLATTLRPVVVHAAQADLRTGRLAGYYERLQRRSAGQFITRAEIERQEHLTLSQLISRSPGVRGVRMRSGAGAVRMRGQSCRPLVWIDGTSMPSGEVDLDAFPLSTLHGIELYLGGTTAPIGHTAMRNQSACGTILLWSRGRDTDPPSRPQPRRMDIDQLVASEAIFTSERVDQAAVMDAATGLEVQYPPDMYAARIGGTVVAEFIVGSDGRIESGTIAIVSATHPMFAAAVLKALEAGFYAPVYTPAQRQGQAVRQVVQQPFGFSPASGRVTAK